MPPELPKPRPEPRGPAWSPRREAKRGTGKHDLRPLADEAVARIRQLVDSLTPEQARQRVLIPAHGNQWLVPRRLGHGAGLPRVFPPCLMRLAGVVQIWDVPHLMLRTWISERVPNDFWIERVTEPVRNHSHALNFSRAYALWHLWEATNNVQHRQNFTDLIRYQVSRPDLWGLEATLGYGVSHWVA